MSKLPRVEKLPLAVRKNLRDEWDPEKDKLETKLSNLMTVPWTIEVDVHQIYAYAHEGFAKDVFGACILKHFKDNIQNLEAYADTYAQDGLNELNTIVTQRVLTLDVDVDNRVKYSGAEVRDGKLVILFGPECINTNIGYGLLSENLLKAINDASQADGAANKLSLIARTFIRKEYDEEAEKSRQEIGEILDRQDVKFEPNFEENFAKLLLESKKKKARLDNEWEQRFGYFTRLYFEGLIRELKSQRFDEDEMLREALNEAVASGVFSLRIIDSLKKRSCSEWEIADGVLFLQCKADTWGIDVNSAAEGLVDGL